MLRWWERADREEVIDAARRLVPNGGPLILRGNDLTGREEAVNVAEHVLSDICGYTCYGGSQRELPGTARTVLTLLLNEIDPSASPAAFGSAFLHESLAGLIDAIVTAVANVTKTALILREIDYTERLAAGNVLLLQRLSASGHCPLVISARIETGTNWTVLPGASIIDLRQFSADDLLTAARTSQELAHRAFDEIDKDVAAVLGGLNDIEPAFAYAFLRGLAG